ncbi:TPA: alpha/beta fold hydrolase [Pseudomonas putida]|nr:alpha/beta fold hydrolase [Pseudomonas putida]
MVKSGYFPTGDGHQLFWQRCGTPGGEPIFFLHGGPAGSSNHRHLEFFDERCFDIILFDQRGCGRSLPHGELQLNDTSHCVEDIDALRLHLGFEKISLLGVSWGSWLAIQYQQRYPECVLKTTLVSVFVPFPENVSAYDKTLIDGLSAVTQGHCAADARAICRKLNSECILQQRHSALHWLRATLHVNGQSMSPDALEKFVDDAAVRAVRLELHYHVNQYFYSRTDETLLLNANTEVIQGIFDKFGILSVRWLRQRQPLRCRLLPAGHNAFESGILKAVRQSLKRECVH